MSDQFIINRLRAKPIEYAVELSHVCDDGEWHLGIAVFDVCEEASSRRRVAGDLRRAAEILATKLAAPIQQQPLGSEGKYTVKISHYVSGGEWMLSAMIEGAGKTDASRRQVVSDLQVAAGLIENLADDDIEVLVA
jgi:hypothetical protein